MARYTQLQEDDVQNIASNYDLTVVDFGPIAGGAADSNHWQMVHLAEEVGAISKARFLAVVFD